MNALQVNNLSLQMGRFRVDGVDLAIAALEYFVLMGRTGSGKSLLLKSICGLIRPESGSICIGDQDVTRLEPRMRGIGYVPQDSALFPHLNVRGNIQFGPRASGNRDCGLLDNLAQTLGIAYLLDRSVDNLSGGERQKVALARALIVRPQLLILDEPVSALDEPARKEICGLLRRIQQEYKVTTIHVCHSRDEAGLVGDRVGVMAGGRLVAVGRLEELRTDCTEEAVQELLNFD